MSEPGFERVVLDTSVLLGARNRELLAAADLGFFRGYWSVWIAAEFARVRTEWIAVRALRESANQADLKARLERSRAKVNTEVGLLSRILTLVDYNAIAQVDVDWLRDMDDRPIVQTAVAAGLPCTLVTDNRRDFLLGERRGGILMIGSSDFLAALYRAHPDASASITAYLGRS